jgi:hypothetical protein
MAFILLISEESPRTAESASFLRRQGHDVRGVRGFLEAYRCLSSEAPDLVLLDVRVRLCGKSLFWFLQRHRPGLPVILLAPNRGYRYHPKYRTAKYILESSGDLILLGRTVHEALRASRPFRAGLPAGSRERRRP